MKNLLALALVCVTQFSHAASKPNVIYIIADDLGYATGAFGKWGLGAPGSASEPLKMGFDRFYGFNCQRQAHHYYPYFLWNDNERDMLWENFGMETGEYAPDLIQDGLLKEARTVSSIEKFNFPMNTSVKQPGRSR